MFLSCVLSAWSWSGWLSVGYPDSGLYGGRGIPAAVDGKNPRPLPANRGVPDLCVKDDSSDNEIYTGC